MLSGSIALLALGGCGSAPQRATLASGTPGGFYHRLGDQINSSTQSTVDLTIQQIDSQGAQQNLTYLLDRKVDFALVQLDTTTAAIRQGKVQAVAVLAHEHLHFIVRDSSLQNLTDLQGKRVEIGGTGSGIRYTAERLLQAARLTIQADDANLATAFQKLKQGQIAAIAYVGSLGANQILRQEFANQPNLRLLAIPASLVNYLTVEDPGSYQASAIPVGTYSGAPPIPPTDLETFSTATVLVTRPDVDDHQVGLVTWALLATARQYSRFYPAMQGGDPKSLLQRGLYDMHPAAIEVFNDGDPRSAWIRYWQNNNDLQSGVFILGATSGVGILLRRWRQERSKKLLSTTAKRISELKQFLPQEAKQAMRGIEELSQEHRVMFIDGVVTSDVYEQVRQKTQMFADQCHLILDQQHKKLVMDTLLLLDEWQATLQTNPDEAMRKLGQIKQHYREMLLADQVDIEAYIELVELTLISLMTLTAKPMPSPEEHPDADEAQQPENVA